MLQACTRTTQLQFRGYKLSWVALKIRFLFLGINFREWHWKFNFEGINFREWLWKFDFAGINIAVFGFNSTAFIIWFMFNFSFVTSSLNGRTAAEAP